MTTKETVDGVTVYSNISPAPQGGQWNVLVRPLGSVSLYATFPGGGYHAVVFDTIDLIEDTHLNNAKTVLERLQPIKEAIEILEKAVKKSEVGNGS